MQENQYDALYETVHPTYFETQRKDVFWYERLWGVLLRELERRDSDRVLVEYGSGPGFLLKYAERRGWSARGVEPSSVARAHARSIGAYSSDAPRYPCSCSSVIATEVLEHVPDPTATLREMRAALVPGGLLALSVPNDENPLQRLFWGGSKPWIHHTHLHYFNPTTLRALVESVGFDVVWQRTSFPVELLLVLPIPRKWAWKLSRVWPAPPFLWRFHVGRHVLLVARKT